MKINVKDVLRYAGAGSCDDPALWNKAIDMAREMESSLLPKTLFQIFDLKRVEDTGDLMLAGTSLVLTGQLARTMLAGCEKVAVAAGTLGGLFEFQLQRWMARDMSQALLYDACGSAAIEAAMDELEEQIRQRMPGWYLSDRFSCGYGDLPLSLQQEISALLQLPQRTGIYVQESSMLYPTKSVTAFIGLSDHPLPARIRGCSCCSFREQCSLRKEGKRCGI